MHQLESRKAGEDDWHLLYKGNSEKHLGLYIVLLAIPAILYLTGAAR